MTQLGLFGFSLAGCFLTSLIISSSSFNVILADGLGYVSLLLLATTLLIGPANLLRKRRNPVNINLRRDAGIWCALTALLHVFFAFQIYEKGDILFYFLKRGEEGFRPQLNVFGTANFVGAAATLVMLALLVLSNDLSLKRLKGKRWKFMQRFNYLLSILVIVHTVAYQLFNGRDTIFLAGVGGLVAVTVAVQGTGVYISLQRNRKRRAGYDGEATTFTSIPLITPEAGAPGSGNVTIPRRRFLALAGSTMVTGFVAGIALRPMLVRETPKTVFVTGDAGALVPESNTALSQPTPTDSSSKNTKGVIPATPTVPAAQPDPSPIPQSPADITAGNSSLEKGSILGSLATLPLGEVLAFNTPDSGEKAFLIHETDGSVKAFSGVCTHRPYDLVYKDMAQGFYCPLHGATFDARTGNVTHRPAERPLQTYDVKVDSEGNIIYSMS